MPLLSASKAYKPFEYPWAFEFWKRQQQIHWMPEEVPLGEDCRDWARKLTDHERNLLTQIFRFFTQADVEVQDCYHEKYGRVFKPTEIKMMLTAFSNMECFDDQSELLTSTGWKNVASITGEDLIAQYEIETQKISFVKPKKVVNYDYSGIMHRYQNRTTDICVTPNHDLISRHPGTGKIDKVKSCQRKLGGNYLYPASGRSSIADRDISLLTKILIAIQADGSLRATTPGAGNWRTVDFTLHKERKIDRLENLLRCAKIEYSHRKEGEKRHRFSFNLPKEVDLDKIKDFGFVDLENLSSREAVQILEEVVFWDGTVNTKTGQRAYYSTSFAAVSIVQAVACLSGQTIATVGINRDAGSTVTLPNGEKHKTENSCYVVSFVDNRVEKTYPDRTEEEYDGKVYCVSVDTENLVSRRNGKVAFTGNTVHIAAYSHLLDTIGMPEQEYTAFLRYKEMADKHDYMQRFGVSTDADIVRTLAVFGGFTEGLQLFASFAMLMNFPRFNKMKGMGQIVSWSVRDESLHCEGIIKLYHTFAQETGCLTQSVKDDISDCCQQVVRLEDAFIDLAFEMGPVEGMTPLDVKRYIRFIADWRLQQLGLKPIYLIGEHPLPWLEAQLNGVEHANFFETRATEYSKAATRGDWGSTWDIFDRRRSANTEQALDTP